MTAERTSTSSGGGAQGEDAPLGQVSSKTSGLRGISARTFALISMMGAAVGFLSFFDQLIPNLVRLSFIFKALTGAYTFARDWVWDGIGWLLARISIQIPALPEIWIDAIAIFSLMFAALNFESVRRYGRSLVLDFGRDVVGSCSNWFGGPHHKRETLFDGDRSELGVVFGFWISGLAARAILASAGFELAQVQIAGISSNISQLAQPAAEAAILGLLIFFALTLVFRACGKIDEAPRNALNAIARAIYLIGWLIPGISGYVTIAFFKGWRSIAFAALLVVTLIGANWAAIHILDPFIAEPPQWVCAMVQADPEALPEPRCGT